MKAGSSNEEHSDEGEYEGDDANVPDTDELDLPEGLTEE